MTNTMHRPFSVGPWLLHHLPRNQMLARATRAYLSWYRSDNNVWADSNGEFALIRTVAPSCRVMLDVGANVGDWSREALTANPALRIHCFEAAPDNFHSLTTAGLPDNVVLNHLAISSADGEVTLNLRGDHSPMNSIVAPATTNGKTANREVKVRSVSIDSYVAEQAIERIDYVKIDVEGAEMLVLEGMIHTLRRGMIDAVQFEYGPFSIYARTFMKDFFEYFEALNFSMFKISHPMMLRFDRYDETMDNFSHQNWIAVRRGSDIARIVDERSVVGMSF